MWKEEEKEREKKGGQHTPPNKPRRARLDSWFWTGALELAFEFFVGAG